MTRIPQGIECPNCAATLTGARCDVCGWQSPRPSRYPVGHDRLTDSYTSPVPTAARNVGLSPRAALRSGQPPSQDGPPPGVRVAADTNSRRVGIGAPARRTCCKESIRDD